MSTFSSPHMGVTAPRGAFWPIWAPAQPRQAASRPPRPSAALPQPAQACPALSGPDLACQALPILPGPSILCPALPGSALRLHMMSWAARVLQCPTEITFDGSLRLPPPFPTFFVFSNFLLVHQSYILSSGFIVPGDFSGAEQAMGLSSYYKSH